MRVFLDANVLFSAAHHAESSFRVFFRLAAAGGCELVASAFAIDEARRNVGRKNPGKLAEFESLVAGVRVCPEGSPASLEWARASALPEKDAPILAAAVQARADLLVTGDRAHFGRLYGARLRGTEVLPPGPAIERILAAAS